MLTFHIANRLHEREDAALSSFDEPLALEDRDDAELPLLRDPVVVDFVASADARRERDLENALVADITRFMHALGEGFLYAGRQRAIDIGDGVVCRLDLLFYHHPTARWVVIDLKLGEFKPEYAGKLNFYCNVVNDQLKHPTDEPTIGLILCQMHDRLLAEYSFAGIDKPIGISTYELTRALPPNMRSALPTVEEIEAELGEVVRPKKRDRATKGDAG